MNKPFNPCLLPDRSEHIPAKIWELLRRNNVFRKTVERLQKLDARTNHERMVRSNSDEYLTKSWQESCRLIERVEKHHPFAGVALQWLVPEPLFCVTEVAWPLGTKWKTRVSCPLRKVRFGRGTTPNTDDACWRWGKDENSVGRPERRGPEIHWTTSKFKKLRDCVNPLREWQEYKWPFTVDHAWPDAPAGFRREFQFIWRNRFDCRPKNPLSNNRVDSPHAHETDFFQSWSLLELVNRACAEICKANDWLRNAAFPSSPTALGSLTQIPQAKLELTDIESGSFWLCDQLARNYRVFAVPKTILTKGAAIEMGKWLEGELKKGSNLYGNLLKGELLNEGDLLGLQNEWNDWLAWLSQQRDGHHKDAHFYRRREYLNSLVSLIYPQFDLANLFAKPSHRKRGKKYTRKGRNE